MDQARQVTILGDGQMALIMAMILADHSCPVRLWSPFPEAAEELSKTRRSPRLPHLEIDWSIEVLTDIDVAISSPIVINAIPTQFIRSVWEPIARAVPEDTIIGSVSKGIEQKTLLRPSQVIAQCLQSVGRGDFAESIGVLAGPNIASELARRLPATMISSSTCPNTQTVLQEAFTSSWLKIYTNNDIVGVEVAGAAKNVIAIAAGVVDGLDIGCNAKSALLARGLAEISRLGIRLGAQLETFFGIAGVGDLATTCFSPEGRNRSCGEAIGRGQSLDEYLEQSMSVVEGVPTTRSISQLSENLGVDMPITRAVNSILFEGVKPREAIRSLMDRHAGDERIG